MYLNQWLCEVYVQRVRTSPDSNDDVYNIEQVAIRLARLELALCERDERLLSCIIDVSSMLSPPNATETSLAVPVAKPQRLALWSLKAKDSIMHCIQETLSSLDSGRKASLLSILVNSSENKTQGGGTLYLLRAIVCSVTSTPNLMYIMS